MVRTIKRYGSRKLYDIQESRYVSLAELAGWIREGQEIRVIENTDGSDVTTQTLIHIISKEGRRGRGFLPSELLHNLIRFGERTVTTGVERVQSGVDSVMRRSLDRLEPVREARGEITRLKERLATLERSIAELEATRDTGTPPKRRKGAARTPKDESA
jgi:polyhydroxyalkanoate synthesis repressor PhaR